ncbi:MAG: DUF1223 domain-containing protein [Thermoanaerobaculia bacterium]
MRKPSILAAAIVCMVAISTAAIVAAPVRTPSPRADGKKSTVILELFTSQGCSSCPPADRLLSTLTREQQAAGTVIPLAYHVDYWNHLGWSDPFSSAAWSRRQNEYARVMRSSQVYTPQLVINGTAQMVGSDEGRVRREIARQLQQADRGVVTLDRVHVEGTQLVVDLRATLDAAEAAGRNAEVQLALFENDATTAVPRGELAGHRLNNDTIVRWQSPVLKVRGGSGEGKTTVRIPLQTAWRSGHLGVAAFIQDSSTFAIYAADSARPAQP